MSMRSELSSWVHEYEQAYVHPDVVPSRSCPSCGMKELRLIFVVDSMGAESGVAVFWCNSCLSGLVPNRAALPPLGSKVLKGVEEIPNFRLVGDSAAD